ncbi:carbamoyltransferase N-terminal domain-containing protein [Micromonospora echinaurantiaca]|uniref:carbamoyltransferase N-terminal domain-containing protein n=1 Tax=Micromonospora echinaurantiaca TaxID=47857 RepID=UPI000B5AFA4E|nr:carbamoyltransferase N-terminal domain-containing protein [Micromonospora echinaurantiaca]
MTGRQVICGLKVTHDGAVAAIDGDRLLFSVEAEKIDNRRRHAHLSDLADVAHQLALHDVDVADLVAVSVDGWVQSRDGRAGAEVVREDGSAVTLDLAGYAVLGGPGESPEALTGITGAGLTVAGRELPHTSYPHATDHALASYCTSPYARTGQPALILVWDGGMPAVLYRFDPVARSLTALGPVLGTAGALYPVFASHFAPFRVSAEQRRSLGGLGDFAQLEALLPISGKAMAYAALAEPDEAAIAVMTEQTRRLLPIEVTRGFIWSAQVLRKLAPLGLSDAAVLASFQEHLLRLLLAGLRAGPAARYAAAGEPLCLSGGCALNIKWNSAIRASGMFSDVWVPPFPNDAGSAIGAACAELIRRTGTSALTWSVFAGPAVGYGDAPPAGWTWRPCEIEEVAELLHREREPVVVLHGRAELGPRALGHRSIIAPADDPGMQDRLNRIKLREAYRPVAPICLVDRAPEVFDPGTPDPYMLFEHQVRAGWRDRVPAVVHADGSARLQTVGPDHPLLFRLLTAYHARSGVPVLCNTSANLPGRGFFPDAFSAIKWGGVRYVWCDGRLYSSGDAGAGSGPA